MISNVCSIGDELKNILKLCFESNVTVGLEGDHGVGKSVIVKSLSEELGIGFLMLDLSTMEPTDLIGVPKVVNGKTKHCPPDFLPTKGKGILLIEEVTRCQSYMRTTLLNLLTTGQIGSYKIPPGWSIILCYNTNDGNNNYEVDELDEAHKTRFLRIRVKADTKNWVKWAQQNDINPKIISFVEQDKNIFDSTCPRSWELASKLYNSWEMNHKGDKDYKQLEVLLSGTIGKNYATAFFKYLVHEASPLESDQVIYQYNTYRAQLKSLKKKKQLDFLSISLKNLQIDLSKQEKFESVIKEKNSLNNIKLFLKDLPKELSAKWSKWIEDRNYDTLWESVC
jgi:hypothetical protein